MNWTYFLYFVTGIIMGVILMYICWLPKGVFHIDLTNQNDPNKQMSFLLEFLCKPEYIAKYRKIVVAIDVKNNVSQK